MSTHEKGLEAPMTGWNKAFPTSEMNLAKRIFQIALVAICYLVVARLSLFLAFENTNASPVWPPSGLAFAAMLIWGRRIWPGIFMGALAANLLAFYGNHHMVSPTIGFVSIAIGIGNTLETVTGYFLLSFWVKGSPLESGIGGLKFVGIAMIMSLVSASIGTVSLGLGELAPWMLFQKILFTWWLGDTAGILVLTPLAIAAVSVFDYPRTLGRGLEAFGFILAIILVAKGVFGGWWQFVGIQPMAYALTPVLLLIAFRSGATVALLGMVLVSLMAIMGTVHGTGPFSTSSMNDKLLLLQAFIGVISVTVLILGASLVERRQTNRELKNANEFLETRVAERTRDLESKAVELNQKNSELESFNLAAVGRELRVIELKTQIST